MKNLYLICFYFFVSNLIFSQQKIDKNNNCAADKIHLDAIKNDVLYKENFDRQNKDYQNWIAKEKIKPTEKQLLTPPH